MGQATQIHEIKKYTQDEYSVNMEHIQIMYTIINSNRLEPSYLNSKVFVIKLQTTDKSSGIGMKRN